jgi:DNA repair exonuclease SbcCD ATPase subunit
MTDNWSAEYKQTVISELNELRESLAECQHGNDKLRESVRMHRRRANDWVKRAQDLERLLESLTPGGPEFSGDPGACAAWVRARLASVGKLAAERNKLREQAEQMAKLLAEAQTAINLLDDDWIRQHPELGCPDPDELLEKIGRVLRDGRPSNA